MPIKRIYLEELARIQDQVNRLFEQALIGSGGVGADPPPGMWAPAVDIIETDEAFEVLAEVAGVRREDIKLEVDGPHLELSGCRQPTGEGQNFLRMERNYGAFRRTFELGAAIDGGRISATLRDGLLSIVAPKRRAGDETAAGGPVQLRL